MLPHSPVLAASRAPVKEEASTAVPETLWVSKVDLPIIFLVFCGGCIFLVGASDASS